eukprot:12927346-Prorocentrum_lima.AAC.1
MGGAAYSPSEDSSEPRLLRCLSRPGSGPGPQFLQIWSKNFRFKRPSKTATAVRPEAADSGGPVGNARSASQAEPLSSVQ